MTPIVAAMNNEVGMFVIMYRIILMLFCILSSGMCLWLVFEIRALPIRAVNTLRILNAIEAVRVVLQDAQDYTEPRLDAVNDRLDSIIEMITSTCCALAAEG